MFNAVDFATHYNRRACVAEILPHLTVTGSTLRAPCCAVAAIPASGSEPAAAAFEGVRSLE